ncbi:MAG TPA: hypothetical protein VF167_01345 [Longimicrobiaceae bacterium]
MDERAERSGHSAREFPEDSLDERRSQQGPGGTPPEATVRDEDLEPHEGLRYIARLFKVLAVLLLLMLVFEVVIGLVQRGGDAVATLVVEATRLIVFAGFLWGAGDIALMLIESNHDLRATRILLGRLNAKMKRLTDIELDELEQRAANPSLRHPRGGD